MKNILQVLALLLLVGCTPKQETITYKYVREGSLAEQEIPVDFIKSTGEVQSIYIDSVKYGILDSTAYPDNHPDRMKQFITYKELDFGKKIEPYSPEYYALAMAYNANRAMEYYNTLFDGKIDFNSQAMRREENYKIIDVVLGDIALFTTPKSYCIVEESNPSVSIPYHEVGHRAFWYIQDEKEGLGIKFKNLTIVHMGLLEYFTMSLNDSPVVGEDALPEKAIRRGDVLYKYPLDDSYKLRNTLNLIERSFPEQMADSTSNVAKYMEACYATYNDEILDIIDDNHQGGMVLASTLWRIRQQIGQDKADWLIAQTILNLNTYMDARSSYYKEDVASLPNRIEWCDVFYGLIQEDLSQYSAASRQIIIDEFRKTGYPIDTIVI